MRAPGQSLRAVKVYASGARRHKLYPSYSNGGRALAERIERRYDGSTTALLEDDHAGCGCRIMLPTVEP